VVASFLSVGASGSGMGGGVKLRLPVTLAPPLVDWDIVPLLGETSRGLLTGRHVPCPPPSGTMPSAASGVHFGLALRFNPGFAAGTCGAFGAGFTTRFDPRSWFCARFRNGSEGGFGAGLGTGLVAVAFF
jgi:hypothetical protein